MAREHPRLELTGITRRYPGVLANDAIDLTVGVGEIHALLGENGAGKSTLSRIIVGLVRPDAGTIRWEGEPVAIASPAEARTLGIAMVFQHFSLFESLTVADNLALTLPRQRADAALAARIRAVSAEYGLAVDPAREVHSMSVGERQRVEILRCLLQSPKLLIMDEPTSVLAPQAVEALFATLRRLAAEGMSVLYISHKLDEIRALCDHATVLRDGRVVGECDPRRESAASLARMMVGSDFPAPRRAGTAPGPVRLSLRGLSLAADDPFGTALERVDLEVRGGEIVGIAGISGNGQRELAAAVAGERLVAAASLAIDGADAGAEGVKARRARGLAYVPEERLGCGAVPEMPLADNVLLTVAGGDLVRHGLVDHRAAEASARATLAGFNVRAEGPRAPAETLSGGNLQKFIVGREIRKSPRLLLVAQPTWGIDVGAAAAIRQALIDLAAGGAAILVISEDLDELFEICDRIAVLARGRLSAPVATRDTDAASIGLMLAGGA